MHPEREAQQHERDHEPADQRQTEQQRPEDIKHREVE